MKNVPKWPWQSAGYSGLKDPKPLFKGESIIFLKSTISPNLAFLMRFGEI